MVKTFQSKRLVHKLMLKNLQSKLLTLLVLSTALPVAAVGIYGISSSTQALTDLNINQIENEISQQVVKIEQVLNNAYGDIVMLSNMPPIQGIVRSRDGNGIDQTESQSDTRTTYADWVKRTQKTFRAMMNSKPQYHSIQYLDEHGNELVHLEMSEDKVSPQSLTHDHNYADKIYFKSTTNLKPGQVYISPVIFHRLSKRTHIKEPVIYYASPIYNQAGNQRGIIVLTLLVRSFANHVEFANEQPNELVILATKQGQYLVHPKRGFVTSSRPHLAKTLQQDYPPAIAQHILGTRQGSIQTERDRIISHKAINQGLNNQMVIMYDLPKHTVLESVSQFKRIAFAVMVLALGTVITIGSSIVRRISRSQTSLYEQAQTAAITAEEKAREAEAALRQLHQTQTQLVQTEKMSSLGQLVAGVAHEINNPVNFIYGNLNHVNEYSRDLMRLIHLYQQDYSEPTPRIARESEAIDLDFLLTDMPKMLESMKLGADRIRQIVLSLRNFSRIDESEMKGVDVHDGIDSTLLILQNRTKARGDFPGVDIVKEYGKLPLVECYAGQLNQVFMNLLSNAIDALEETVGDRQEAGSRQETGDRRQEAGDKRQEAGDGRQETGERLNSTLWQNPPLAAPWQPQIVISTEAFTPTPSPTYSQTPVPSTWVRIRIRDNGAGIPAEIRDRLFEPFFTTKPIGKGTGLGLSISYQIITERHQGHLVCTSAPGQGTEFHIEIPIHQGDIITSSPTYSSTTTRPTTPAQC